MNKEDLPIHLKFMASLGLVKIKTTPRKNDQALPKGFSTMDRDQYVSKGTLPKGFYNKTKGYHKKSISISSSQIIAILAIGVPIALGVIPLIMDAEEDAAIEEAQTLADKARIIAEKEAKNAWEDIEWDNPDNQAKLYLLRDDIDQSSCSTLENMFTNNERWTLRAYVAHTILEKGC